MNLMNLRQLQIFREVAQQLSFSRVAEELFLTQSAVSQHVRLLEEYLGVKLFSKVGRSIQLTEAGSYLVEYADKIFALLSETQEVMEDVRQMRRGSLRVIADTAAGVYLVPKLLGQFHRVYPHVRIKLEVANRRTVIQRLIYGEPNLGFMGYPEDIPDLIAHEFADNHLVVIAAPDHPMAKREYIGIEAIAEEPFLIREVGSGTRVTLERHMLKYGITLNATMELGNNTAIKEAVAAGLGVSAVSKTTISHELETGRLVILPVEHFPIERKWYVVHSKQKTLSPLVQRFHDALLNHEYEF